MFLGLSAGEEKPVGSGIFGCSQVVLPLRTWLLCSEKVLLSGPIGVVWVFFLRSNYEVVLKIELLFPPTQIYIISCVIDHTPH